MLENIEVMLEKEFEYYLKNQEDLVKKYNGKVLVIIGEKVMGAYNDDDEAIDDCMRNNYEPGTFLVQKCSPGEKDYTQTFHSCVFFA